MFASGIPTSSSGFFPRKGFSDTSSVNGSAGSISQSSTAHSSIMNFDVLQTPVQKVEESEMHQWREGHFLRCFYKPGRATILQERSEDVTKQLAGRISHGVSTSCLRFEPAKPLWNEMPQSDKDSSAQC